MRGEQKISLYWITVILVSAPFIVIMTRVAYRFNLKKWEAAGVSFLVIAFALVFPAVLRREKILHWLLGVCCLLLFIVGVTVIRNRFVALPPEDGPSDPVEEQKAHTSEVLPPGHEQEAVQEEVTEEEAGGSGPTEIFDEDEGSVETEANLCEETIILEDVTKLEEIPLIHMKDFSLQGLIEKGFQAKEQERFHLAAQWFMLALDQKPSYDIAFYLIVETCEHWKNGSSIYDALDKVAPYINEYIQNAPPEWRTQLMEWLENENLPVPGEFRKD